MQAPSKVSDPSALAAAATKRASTSVADSDISDNVIGHLDEEQTGDRGRIVTRLQARTTAAAAAAGAASSGAAKPTTMAEKQHRPGPTRQTRQTGLASNSRRISAAATTITTNTSRASIGASSSTTSTSDVATTPVPAAKKRTSARLASSSSDTSRRLSRSNHNNGNLNMLSTRTGMNPPRKAAMMATNKRASPTAKTPMSISKQHPYASPSARPKFSTYQQQYTPSKNTSTSSPMRVQKHEQPKSRLQQQRQPTISQLRKQTELLHLSLLHSSYAPNIKAWELSAKAQLSSRFAALQASYESLLSLQRQARQRSNLLALHQWSGGNTVALVRKSNTLLSVLSEVCALTSPGGSREQRLPRDSSEENDGRNIAAGANTGIPVPDLTGSSQEQEIGAYAAVVQQFEMWVTWVLDVWHERDQQQEEHQRFLARLRSEQYGMYEEEEMIREYKQQQKQQLDQHLQFTRVDGLGDAFKSELRRLVGVLNLLEARLSEPNSPSIPEHPLADAGILPPKTMNEERASEIGRVKAALAAASLDDSKDGEAGSIDIGTSGDGRVHQSKEDVGEAGDAREQMNGGGSSADASLLATADAETETREMDTSQEAKADDDEEEEEEEEGENEAGVSSICTPRRILGITTSMVQNMKDELQLMRELDFEVVIGEQAWVEWKVHGIGNDIERLLL